VLNFLRLEWIPSTGCIDLYGMVLWERVTISTHWTNPYAAIDPLCQVHIIFKNLQIQGIASTYSTDQTPS
jgi:hypothetical protein